ncbi:MAG: AAA family ATPase, partial [Oligoflexia bacterium]|nr:AAA family ATPase [Oligoflexia bacterium]
MHIRKLEIHGFKSFPDRQVFHFGPGISGVVGPNGCGKSNVVDAVKWCLGEQSAKSLRGSSMSDIIFAGTQERPSTGLAEVSLTFAAGDEPFPGEYARHAEIEISRRLYRDGKGEYRINGARSRLRDIQDLFLDTGANNRLYSFIEQGRIGQIISARPEQRRALIEEAAGISRFKARKDEAEQKLVGTLENVGRAVRTLDDLGARLRSLERQVRKAVRYRRLKSAIRQAEVFLGLARFAGLVADRRVLASQVRDSEAEEASAIRDVTRREQNLAQARAELEQVEGQAGQLRDDLAELEASRREGESARRYQAKERDDLLERAQRLHADAQTADDQATAARARRDEIRRAGAELGQRLEALDVDLEGVRAALQTAERALGQRRQRVEAHKDSVLRLVRQVARDRAGLDTARMRVSDLGQRRTRLTQRRDQVCVGIEALETAVKQALAAAAQTQDRAAAARQALQTARQVEGAAQQTRASLRRDVGVALRALDQRNQERAVAERALAGARARRDSLQALQASHAGVDDAVRQVLQVDGTLGTLAEHLDVPQDLERVLTVALGPALDCVLARDDAVTARAAAAARGGRVSILSLAGTAPAPGPFVDRFEGTDAGRKALALLFGACGVTNGLENALASWRSQGGCVVVDGAEPAFVDQRGLVQRGVGGGAGAAVLARRRQLAEASDQLLGLQQAVDDAAAAVDLAASTVETARSEDA